MSYAEKVENKQLRVRVSIKRIIAVDLVEQTYSAEIFLEVSWIDFELKGPKVICDERVSDQLKGLLYVKGCDKPCFAPRVTIRNLIETIGDDSNDEWFHIYDDHPAEKDIPAICCYRVNMKAKFQQTMELHLFPADLQLLTLQLMSGHEAEDSDEAENDPEVKGGRRASSEISALLPRNPSRPSSSSSSSSMVNPKHNLSVVKEGEKLVPETKYHTTLIQNCNREYVSFVNTKNFALSNEYWIHPHVLFEESRTDRSESASAKQYAVLNVSAVVIRQPGYWLYNVMLPLYLLTAVSSASFAIVPEEVGDRCGVTLTMMLTTVAYKYIISDRLPSISYLTLIDRYLMLCLVINVSFIVVSVEAGISATVDIAKNGPSINNPYEYADPLVPIRTFLIVWTLFNIALLLLFFFLYKREKAKLMPEHPHLWTTGLKTDVTELKLISDFEKAHALITGNVSRSSSSSSGYGRTWTGGSIQYKRWEKKDAFRVLQLEEGLSDNATTSTNSGKHGDDTIVAENVAASTKLTGGTVSKETDFGILSFQTESAARLWMETINEFVANQKMYEKYVRNGEEEERGLLDTFTAEYNTNTRGSKSGNSSNSNNSSGDGTASTCKRKGSIFNAQQTHTGAAATATVNLNLESFKDNTSKVKVEMLKKDWTILTMGMTHDRGPNGKAMERTTGGSSNHLMTLIQKPLKRSGLSHFPSHGSSQTHIVVPVRSDPGPAAACSGVDELESMEDD